MLAIQERVCYLDMEITYQDSSAEAYGGYGERYFRQPLFQVDDKIQQAYFSNRFEFYELEAWIENNLDYVVAGKLSGNISLALKTFKNSFAALKGKILEREKKLKAWQDRLSDAGPATVNHTSHCTKLNCRVEWADQARQLKNLDDLEPAQREQSKWNQPVVGKYNRKCTYYHHPKCKVKRDSAQVHVASLYDALINSEEFIFEQIDKITNLEEQLHSANSKIKEFEKSKEEQDLELSSAYNFKRVQCKAQGHCSCDGYHHELSKTGSSTCECDLLFELKKTIRRLEGQVLLDHKTVKDLKWKGPPGEVDRMEMQKLKNEKKDYRAKLRQEREAKNILKYDLDDLKGLVDEKGNPLVDSKQANEYKKQAEDWYKKFIISANAVIKAEKARDDALKERASGTTTSSTEMEFIENLRQALSITVSSQYKRGKDCLLQKEEKKITYDDILNSVKQLHDRNFALFAEKNATEIKSVQNIKTIAENKDIITALKTDKSNLEKKNKLLDKQNKESQETLKNTLQQFQLWGSTIERLLVEKKEADEMNKLLKEFFETNVQFCEELEAADLERSKMRRISE